MLAWRSSCRAMPGTRSAQGLQRILSRFWTRTHTYGPATCCFLGGAHSNDGPLVQMQKQAFSLSVDWTDERSSCQIFFAEHGQDSNVVEAAVSCPAVLGASFELFCDFFLPLGIGLRFLKKQRRHGTSEHLARLGSCSAAAASAFASVASTRRAAFICVVLG